MKTPTVDFYQDNAEQHRWRLKHGNGKILAAASEGFKSKRNARRNFCAVRDCMARALFMLAVLFGVSGCATKLSTSDIAHIATVSQQAAAIGTREVLLNHPDWKPHFALAATELAALSVSPSISVQDILKVVQQLPVRELKSQEARLSFEGATLLISAINVPTVPADKLAELQPIAKAIADGINQGMN